MAGQAVLSAPEDGKTLQAGVETRAIAGQGRGFVATRGISSGDVVLMERPWVTYDLSHERCEVARSVHVLLCEHKGENLPGSLPYAFQWLLWVVHFLELDPDIQADVMAEVYTPAVGDGVDGVEQSPTFAEAQQFSAFLLERLARSFMALAQVPQLGLLAEGEDRGWDVPRLSGLLLLYTSNFHQFEGRAALFRQCCKLNHVCGHAASTVYITGEKRGWGCHVATRDIREGEQVTTDYLHGIEFLSIFERQRRLLESKLFVCNCEACLGPDVLRAFPCGAGGCGGRCVGEGDVIGGREADAWVCERCGAQENALSFFAGLMRRAGRGVGGDEHALWSSFRELERQHLVRPSHEAPLGGPSQDASYNKIIWSPEDLQMRIDGAVADLGEFHPSVLRMKDTLSTVSSG